MSDFINDYRSLLKMKKDCEMLIAQKDAIRKNKIDELTKKTNEILKKYNITSLEDLPKLKEQKIMEATELVSKIKQGVGI